MPFSHGHAIIIGVGKYKNIPGADVPIAASDAQAVASILQDDRVCGYPSEQVHLLLDDNATRARTIEIFKVMASQLREDDTLLLFYCGHGAAGEDGSFYFVSHDAQVSLGRVVTGTGLRDAEFIDLLRGVKARRMLVVLNTCFSGLVSPSLDLGSSLEIQRPPEDTHSAILGTGSGRVIITASGEDQKSWIGTGAQSIFTQAFINGLRGRGVANRGGTISVFDLYESIYESVSETVAEKIRARQEPELTVLKGVGPFPVSLYNGATVFGEFDETRPIPALPTVKRVNPEKAQKRMESYLTIINTGGSTFFKGDVNVQGGDFTGRDNIVYDHVTQAGNVIDSSGVGIGSNVQVSVTQGGAPGNFSQAFALLYAAIVEGRHPNQAEAVETVWTIQKEVEKGKQARDSYLSQQLERLLDLAPEISSAVARTFADPLLADCIGPASRMMIERISRK